MSAREATFARRFLVALILLTAAFGTAAQTCTPPEITLTHGSNPMCPQQMALLEVMSPWATFEWSTGSTDSWIWVNPTETTSYTVTVSDGNGCTVTSAPFVLEVEPPPAPVVNAPATACTGARTTVSVQPPANGSTWLGVEWEITGGHFWDPWGGQYTTAYAETVEFVADGSGPVTLTVSGVDNQTWCDSAAAVVTVPVAAAPVINAPSDACPWRDQYASIDGNWAEAQWTITGGMFRNYSSYPYERSSVSGTNVTFYSNGSGPVTLTVHAFETIDSCAVTATHTVTQRELEAPVITAPASACPVWDQYASVEPPDDGSGYWQQVWWSISGGKFPNHFGSPQSTTSGESVRFYVEGPGPATLTAYAVDQQGCYTPQATHTVNVRTIEAPVIVAPESACPMWDQYASIQQPTDGTYWRQVWWSITGGKFPSSWGEPRTTSSGERVGFYVEGPGPATLTAYVLDEQGCYSPQATHTVGVRTIPAPAIDAPPEACPMWEQYASIVQPTDGTYWRQVWWSITGGKFPSHFGEARTTSSGERVNFYVEGPGPATLTAYVLDEQGCYSPQATRTVGVRTIPAPAIDAPVEACPMSDQYASIVQPTDGTYWRQVWWSITGGKFPSHFGEARTTSSGERVNFYVEGPGPATLTAHVLDEQGCYSPQATRTVNVRTIEAPAIDAPAEACPMTDQYASIVQPTDGTYWRQVWWSITNGKFPSYDGGPQTTSGGERVRFYVEGPEPATLTAFAMSQEGCYTPIGSRTIQPRTIDPIVVNAPAAVCALVESTATVAPSATGPWQNVFWEITGGVFRTASGDVSQTTGEQVMFVAHGSGPVTLTARGHDSLGCNSPSTTAVVAVNAPPAAGITASMAYDEYLAGEIASQGGGVVEVCGTGTVNLIPAVLNASHTYQWSDGSTRAILGVRTPGTYSVTVTAPNGCATTSTVTVNFTNRPPQPSITASATQLCPAGGSVTLTAPAADGWLWSNGATTQSIVVTEAGSYSVRTRTHVCYSLPSAPIVIGTGTSSITTNDSLALCPNGTVTLTANDGTSWLWSNGATTRSIAVTEPGAYSVTTSNNGCTYAQSQPTEVTLREVTIVPAGPTSICDSQTVRLDTTGGTSWLWSNGARTPYLYVNESGSYTVTTTFADGCTITSDPQVVDVQTLDATIAADRTSLCSSETGASIEFSSSVNGTGPFTYQWYDGGAQEIDGATSPTLTFTPVTSSGYVYVRVTNALGCSDTSDAISYEVVAPPEAAITPLGATTFCEGGSVTLRASDGASWLWSNGATTRDITVDASGSYNVTVDNGTCSATSTSTVVTVNPLPAATITALGPTTFCAGNSVTLRASDGASWLWSNGATTREIAVDATGSYTVTVNDGACSATSTPTVVTVNPLPVATITALAETTFCKGGSVTLRASDGASWLWSNGATTREITVSASGTYSVTVNDGTCSATSAATVVTVNPLPVATITALGDTTFCEGGSVTLRASNGASWLWSNGQTTREITVAASGTYSVTVNDGTCSATSTATVVAVNPLPAATITALGATTFCEGGSVTLRASDGASWLWSNGATTREITVDASGSYSVTVNDGTCSATSTATVVAVNPLPAATITALGPTTFCTGNTVTLRASDGASWLWSNGATTREITVDATGSYSVTVNDGACSATSAATVVTVNPLPIATITALGATTFCEGGSVTLRASDGASWLWSNGATAREITVTASGSYSVTVNDGACSATSTPAVVTVNPVPVATITALGATTFCEGGSVTLRASDGASWRWSNGATTREITVNASGSYSVTVNDGTCSATSTATVVTVNPPPVATITALGETTFCEGGSVTLRASDGASWLWSNGATTREITVNASGSYSVTVNDGTCSATSAATVVAVNPLPAATITALGATTFCEGGSVTLRASDGASWLWSNGATTREISVAASGSYSVTVNDGTCSATSTATIVTVNPLPIATIAALGATTFCEGGSVTLRASDGASWLWSNGQTTREISVAASGTYSVTVNNGTCSATSTTTVVTVNPLPVATVTALGNTTFCEGGSVTLRASDGTSWLWSTGQNTREITVSASGNYTVTVGNGSCSAASAPANVTVNPVPPADISVEGSLSLCPNSTVTLRAPAGYSYLWSTGATSQSITVSQGGSYSVTVSTATCSRTSSPVVVTNLAATAITAQPANITVPRNQQGQLSVTATAAGTPRYQWYTVNADGTNPQLAANGTDRILRVGPWTKKGTHYFRVVVSSSVCGQSTVTSRIVTVTVN
jgi:hypothetical protein